MIQKKRFSTPQEVLDFAIEMEALSIEFYTELAIKTKFPHIQGFFYELANQKLQHKEKLQQIDIDTFSFEIKKKVKKLQIKDYINPDVNCHKLNYNELLTIALSREKRASQLYEKLSVLMVNPKLKEVFDYLVQEEMEHKARFEQEYENIAFANKAQKK